MTTPGPDRQQPLRKPARSALTMRDMAVSLGVLAVSVLLIGGIAGVWTFAPAGPTVDPRRLPVVDAPAELRAIAPGSAFPVRIPAVPAGWRSNSVGRDRVGDTDATTVRTGYVTPEGRYVRLLQSDAAEPDLLAVETGGEPVTGEGVEDVGGRRWVVYGRGADEPIWIAEIATPTPVRLLITGSGGIEDFRALAGAATIGELVP